MKRADIVKCPFFRFESVKNTSMNHNEVNCFCSLDVFISRNFPIKNKEPSKNELGIIKKKTLELCSMECPKIWDICDKNIKEKYPEFDLSFCGIS